MNIRTIVLAAATTMVLPALAAAQTWYDWANGAVVGNRVGTIATVNGSSFTLVDGSTVFMHDGTVVRPTGLTLHPGMRVSIDGAQESNGNLNALEVDLLAGRPYYGWNQGSVINGRFGTITSVNGNALMLDDGTTVFLQDHTLIVPRGLELEPGMHVSVAGTTNGNNINAGEIRLTRGYGFDRGWSEGSVTARAGTIVAVDKTTARLADGTVVFLREGTVINPTGTDLTPGMRIRVTGRRTADRNIDATSITVV